MNPDQKIDANIDSILKAAGSALRHHTMQKTLDDLRNAMREIMVTSGEGYQVALQAENAALRLALIRERSHCHTQSAHFKQIDGVLNAAKRVSRYDWSMPDIVRALGDPAYDDICDLCEAVRAMEE